ncbi:MAG: HAD family hydrolase [Agathobaculum sp.]|jgi:putative hydrolase of the HAD superfamily|uniref:HAD family hydrolase n=1 Tax=Agathobaculum sp. TaxID=2048138 RepID=UPI003D91E7BE
MMLKTIIMDFDGLIVDTEVVWYQIFADWFRRNKNYALSVQEFLTCVGSEAEALFRRLDEKGVHVDRAAFEQQTFPLFVERSGRLPAKPGVRAFLQNARQRGLSVALASSSVRKKPASHLERLDLMQYFDVLVTAEDVARVKPFPDLFCKAAAACGSSADECLVVEDSLNGLQAGRNAGMRVLVVPNDVTRYCDFSGQYRMCASLTEADLSAIAADFCT